MKAYSDFSDERLRSGRCTYCFSPANTRDHIPARVFLRTPYPDNLHAVPSCEDCNNTLSKDEEYLAFLLDYIPTNRTDNYEDSCKPMIEKYKHFPTLEKMLIAARRFNEHGDEFFLLDSSRIVNVIRKFAFAHVQYETGEAPADEPASVNYSFFNQMTDEQIFQFNSPICDGMYPEVGSRLMQRIIETGDDWEVAQEKNYRYYVHAGSFVVVRIVFKEILYCEVSWD